MKKFSNSARGDGVQLQHWVRDDVEYADYPFARFNRKVEIVRYTDDEYRQYLAGESSPTLIVRAPHRGSRSPRTGACVAWL